MESGSHLPTAARAPIMQPKASAKGHRAGCSPWGTARCQSRPCCPQPLAAHCRPPLHFSLQPVARSGQWPPEPPWPSGQRTDRLWDGGVQADERAIGGRAAGPGGGASLGMTQVSAPPWTLPSRPRLGSPHPQVSQPVPGKAGGGVPWHEAHLGRRPPPHTRMWPYKASLGSVRLRGSGGGGVRRLRGLVDRARTILSGQHTHRAGLATGPASLKEASTEHGGGSPRARITRCPSAKDVPCWGRGPSRGI